MAVVVDASVLIAFLDPRDAGHEQVVEALGALEQDELVLPASAFAEVLVGAHRAGAAEVRVVGSFIEEARVRVEPISADVARRAAQLRARHTRIGLPDALVMATADIIAARMILTRDRAWRGVVPHVRLL
jgi:predicted nucleic acid-binding protein